MDVEGLTILCFLSSSRCGESMLNYGCSYNWWYVLVGQCDIRKTAYGQRIVHFVCVCVSFFSLSPLFSFISIFWFLYFCFYCLPYTFTDGVNACSQNHNRIHNRNVQLFIYIYLAGAWQHIVSNWIERITSRCRDSIHFRSWYFTWTSYATYLNVIPATILWVPCTTN